MKAVREYRAVTQRLLLLSLPPTLDVEMLDFTPKMEPCRQQAENLPKGDSTMPVDLEYPPKPEEKKEESRKTKSPHEDEARNNSDLPKNPEKKQKTS
jgi:hypothetical protein